MEQQKHVFISYVRENSEQVQRLCDDLTKHGIKVWLNLPQDDTEAQDAVSKTHAKQSEKCCAGAFDYVK